MESGESIADDARIRQTKTTLYLPKDLHYQIKIEAVKEGIPMTQLVIRALEHELEQVRKSQSEGQNG